MQELRKAALAVVAFTLVLGLAYPLAMTGISQVVFPDKADGKGSLIGRDFAKDDGAFQSRPSATGYSATATYFNNQGPNQRDLAKQLKGNVRRYLKRELPYNPGLTAAGIPSDAVTTSASGVDPHISEANALLQANRVAEVRGIPLARVRELINDHASQPLFGLGGEKSINVADLNAALGS